MENKEKYISPIGDNWEDVKKELFTPEELAASKIRVALIGEMIKARQKKGYSQMKLEELSGVKQPVISRLELGTSDPQLSTMIKILAVTGKTLKVVPLKKEKTKQL